MSIQVTIPSVKISELQTGQPVVASDVFPTLQDMGGTPSTRKVTAQMLHDFKWLDIENKSGVEQPIGTPVTRHVSGTGFSPAQATNAGTLCMGLCLTAVLPAVSGKIVSSGTIRLSDWTAIVGTELLEAKIYYLDVVAGKLTSTPPSGDSQYVQRVGVALSANDLEVNIEAGILL